MLLPISITAQQPVSHISSVVIQPKKPIIDTSAIRKWPSWSQPILSPNASYAAYAINYKSVSNNILTIRGIHNSWKKEIKTNINDFFFTTDSKNLYWDNADTLFSLVLGQDKIDFIPDLISLKFPSLKKGEWIAYQLKQSPEKLIVQNLLTHMELQFDNVTEYIFNDAANALLIQRQDSVTGTSLRWFDLSNEKVTEIWSAGNGKQAAAYTFDKQGNQLAFIVSEKEGGTDVNSIWYYNNKEMKKAKLKVNNQIPRIKNSLSIGSQVLFSGNGKWLFFDLYKKALKQNTNPEAAQVDIWSYKDRIIYPEQSNLQWQQGAIAVNNNGFIYISGNDEQLEDFSPAAITGDHIVVRDHQQAPFWWSLSPPHSYWLVSLKDGTKTLLKGESKYPLWAFSFSPGGKWLIFWDPKKEGYVSYNIQQHKSFFITGSIPAVSREVDYIDGLYSEYAQPVSPPAGWYTDDEAILVYDRYDIWKLDPACRLSPVNITNGYGAKHKIKLRLVYTEDEIGQPLIYTEKDTILLTGFNTLNKYNGFLVKELNQKGDPNQLTMGPYLYYLVESQKPHIYSFGNGLKPVMNKQSNTRGWIVKRSSATEFPNYFFSSDLKHFKALTDLQPQREYNWLTAELITWKQLDGTMSQGILYKPEDFDPKRKYPVIFNYYKQLSHRLYGFPSPALASGNINIPWFVSRGYLVFTPDIYFSTASHKGGKLPGESAYNAIESAARHLAKLSYVNSKKMGLQGHSFGGGLTNYIITRSKLFAAACSAAGTTSDEISAYLGMTRTEGNPPHAYRMLSAESGLDRIGATLWQRPDLYLQASPVLKADQIITPLLIMHNKGDVACDWGQSAELYMALRRLGKKVWMLQYDNEDHGLINQKNKIDFTVRLTQFFDYYLKDAPPSKWMTDGVPARLKGIETGYEHDNDNKP